MHFKKRERNRLGRSGRRPADGYEWRQTGTEWRVRVPRKWGTKWSWPSDRRDALSNLGCGPQHGELSPSTSSAGVQRLHHGPNTIARQCPP